VKAGGNKVLPEVSKTYCTMHKDQFTQQAKKNSELTCNGTTPVYAKTIHGKFQFQLQSIGRKNKGLELRTTLYQ